jgi:hypothetical protein
MKNHAPITKVISIILVCSIFLTSCTSTTVIHSKPGGAKIYLNDEYAGTTPYTHSDTKIVGSTTTVKLEKEGYETLTSFISRNEEVDVGAIIGGIFFLFPFLWTMKYKPSRTYELKQSVDNPSQEITTGTQDQSKSKADKLRELKQLFDENLITKEEYEKERKKILEEI